MTRQSAPHQTPQNSGLAVTGKPAGGWSAEPPRNSSNCLSQVEGVIRFIPRRVYEKRTALYVRPYRKRPTRDWPRRRLAARKQIATLLKDLQGAAETVDMRGESRGQRRAKGPIKQNLPRPRAKS